MLYFLVQVIRFFLKQLVHKNVLKNNKIKGDTHNTGEKKQKPWESISKNERNNYILVTGKDNKKYGIKKVNATGTTPTTTVTEKSTPTTPPKCTLNPTFIKVVAWGGAGIMSGRRSDRNGEMRIKKRNFILENEYQFREYGNRINLI